MRVVSTITKLETLAARLAELRVTSEEEVATQGLLLGAIYGLRQAAEGEYRDSRNSAGKAVLGAEFSRVASRLAGGQAPEQSWLAGYHFSSALMRIAACRERLDTMEGRTVNTSGELRRVVNTLKHHANAHVQGDWKITFAGVLESLAQLCSRLKKHSFAQDDG